MRLRALLDLPVVLLEPGGVPLDAALRDLKHRIDRAGILSELRQRAWAQTPGEKRRRKAARARARERRRAQRQAAAEEATA